MPVKKGETHMIKIDTAKCTGCGACKENCPVGALEIVDSKAVANEQCIDCGACTGSCPVEALTMG